MAQHCSKPAHLEASELGTKEYWDKLYTTELINHASHPSDKGTVWFDDSDAEAKLLATLRQWSDDPEADCDDDGNGDDGEEGLPHGVARLQKKTTSFLDLGCGNGSLLFALRGDGWQGRLLGIDYSEKSVALARQIASAADEEGEDADEDRGKKVDVEFAVWDVLAGPCDTVLGGDGPQSEGWDVVLDKGTFDAMSLSDERDGAGRRICEGYQGRVLKLLRPGGLFFITSCNWTESELKLWFKRDNNNSGEQDFGHFVEVGRVAYPSFSFGGVKGQTISTLCFQRRP